MVANPNFTNDDGTAGLSNLTSGAVDAYFSGSWDAAKVKEGLGDNYGAAAMPTFKADGKDYQMKSLAGSKAVAFNPNAKSPEAASAFAGCQPELHQRRRHRRPVEPDLGRC